MLGENLELRRGTADDAAFLAHIVNIVSEGVTEALLGNALPGLSAEKALEMVFRRGEAPYAPEKRAVGRGRRTRAGAALQL